MTCLERKGKLDRRADLANPWRMNSDNPYAPPQGPDEPYVMAGAPQPLNPIGRTGAPKVFGVLSIVFASLILLVGLMQSCTGLVSRSFTTIGDKVAQHEQNQPKAEQLKVTMRFMATIYTGMGLQGLLLAIMSGLLLAIGIGQLRYRAWAGQWTVYWCWAGFAVIGAMVAISFLLIGPAYEDLIRSMARHSATGAMPAGMGSSLGSLFGGTTGIMTILFYAPYPIIMLVYFSKDHIRAAMNT